MKTERWLFLEDWNKNDSFNTSGLALLKIFQDNFSSFNGS